MRHMARVLAPGGRIALNVWGALDRQPFYVALVDGIVEFLGEEGNRGITPGRCYVRRAVRGNG